MSSVNHQVKFVVNRFDHRLTAAKPRDAPSEIPLQIFLEDNKIYIARPRSINLLIELYCDCDIHFQHSERVHPLCPAERIIRNLSGHCYFPDGKYHRN